MKTREVLLLSDAADDLEVGRAFYEAKQERAGDYLWDSLISDIESLTLFAGIHRKEAGYHRLLSKRFPYAIYYYEVIDDLARVVAILPMRRNPHWLRSQLTKRG